MENLNSECLSKIIKHFKETSLFHCTGLSDWLNLVNVEFLGNNHIKFSVESKSDEGCVIERYSIEYRYTYSDFKILSESYFYEHPYPNEELPW